MIGLLIVGEQPSRADGEALAGLAPRLAEIGGVDCASVLAIPRVNLLTEPGRWDARAARAAACRLDEDGPPVPYLLLGRRVAVAFGLGRLRLFSDARLASGRPITLVPHPSGRCRAWNDPEARRVGRKMLHPLLRGLRS